MCQILGLDVKVIPSRGTTNGFDFQALGLHRPDLEKSVLAFWEENNNNQNDNDDTQFFEHAFEVEGKSQSSSSSALEADRDGNGQTDSTLNGSTTFHEAEYQRNVKAPRGKSGDDELMGAEVFVADWENHDDVTKEEEEKRRASMEEVEEANGHAADDDDYGLADAAAANNIKDREEQRAMKGGDDVVSIGELGSGLGDFLESYFAGGSAKGGAANGGLGENPSVLDFPLDDWNGSESNYFSGTP